ncbi:MAG: hypothetical protein U0R70_08820 [Solirubrobacteraceae bacterium]
MTAIVDMPLTVAEAIEAIRRLEGERAIVTVGHIQAGGILGAAQLQAAGRLEVIGAEGMSLPEQALYMPEAGSVLVRVRSDGGERVADLLIRGPGVAHHMVAEAGAVLMITMGTTMASIVPEGEAG